MAPRPRMRRRSVTPYGPLGRQFEARPCRGQFDKAGILGRDTKGERLAEQGFNPAAEFLLDMNWINLFEQADGTGIKWRCKGCGAVMRVHEREPHYNKHKGIRKRSETMRKQRIARERADRLAKARAMKGQA